MSSATSTPLQLFPSPSSYNMPRKSSMKKPKMQTLPDAHSPELQGVAWSVTMQPTRAVRVEPASEQFKHNGASKTSTPRSILIKNQSSPQRQLRTRRRSSAPNMDLTILNAEPLMEEDQLSPLPINTSFTQSTPPRIRTPVARMKRSAVPEALTAASAFEPNAPLDDDQLSPLPSKQHFTPPSAQKPEFPQSDGLARSKSDASARPPKRIPSPPPNRSIFPQYDHNRILAHQQYYPSPTSAAQSLDSPAQYTRSGGVSTPPSASWHDSAVVLPDLSLQVPKASSADALAIWHASTTTSPPAGRKVKLDLKQPSGHAMTLAIGIESRSLYSMEATEGSPPLKPTARKQLCVQKTCPQSEIPTTVAQLQLPATASATTDQPLTSIFPHQAAVDAIHFVANTPTACEIAHFDPSGVSPEAARLAQDAVADAHHRFTCQLSRTTRRRDSLSDTTASYVLQHPMLGALIITVKKTSSPSAPRHAKARIALHHPSATEAAVAAENLVLLSLDFASNACVIDTPGLMALDEPYMIDTALSAVFATAVLENDLVVNNTMTFEPPPKTPTIVAGSSNKMMRRASSKKTRKVRWYRRTNVVEIDEGSGELPGVARGVLAVIGIGLRGVVWVVGVGFKAGSKPAR